MLASASCQPGFEDAATHVETFWRMTYSALVSIADWTQITDPAQQGNTDNSEGEAMNMREVGEALDAAINDNDDDSLRALLQSADFDVLRLANMTFDRPDAVRAFAAVLSTAVMVAQDTAVDAEDMAAEAAERAANAETKAAEASDKAAAADSNCDGVFGRSVENAHVILGQGEHISALQRQMSALAAIPSVAPTSPVVS